MTIYQKFLTKLQFFDDFLLINSLPVLWHEG